MTCKFHPFRKPSKYRNEKTVVDGIRFDSQKEARYYKRLKLEKESGNIIMFLRQVPFDLPGNIKYRVDFQVWFKDGEVRHIDVKGFSTKEYILKKAQVEALYPVTIVEV